VSGAGVGGQAVLVAFMGARVRRARGASPTGPGCCRDGGATREPTTRCKSWWVSAVFCVAFFLRPGLSRTAQPGRMLIANRQPNRARACVW